MLESFGARLRQRREAQEIALITIAEQTKIKLSLLEALERDDVSHWPSGIFRRAFIRAYAHVIGLNPDVVVREFLEVHPDPVEVVQTASTIALGANAAAANAGPTTRLRDIVGSAIESLSRLRRSSAVEDLVRADRAPVNVPARAVPDHSAAANPFPGPGRAERSTEGVADCSPANERASSEPGRRAAAHTSPKPGEVDRATGVIARGTPAAERSSSDPDFLAVAHLCTEFGRVENTSEMQPLLQEAARILDAPGLIVWVWDTVAAKLRPALTHGYSDKVLAQLPTVRRDGDNATAAAFRTVQTCTVSGIDRTSGALVVPLLTSAGCAGVLAIELQHGREHATSVRAVATIFAALLAQLTGVSADIRREAEMHVPPPGNVTTPILRADGRR